MRITKIVWKNIYSYGNRVEQLDFSGMGIWQLFGKSGSGKSTIIQMPQLLIYGKTMSKTTKSDIANRTNKHGVVRGEIIVNKDVYVVTRRFEPDSLEIIKNGVVMDFPTKVEAQSYIEHVIAGDLPLDIYKNVLTLSLNNFTSFITISAADKRKIIDNIFSMDIVNTCVSYLKEDKKILSSKINSETGGVNVLDGQIFRVSNNIENKKNALRMNETEASRGDEIRDSISDIDKKMPALVEEMTSCNGVYHKLVDDKSELVSKKSGLEFEKREYDKKISLFKQDKCPTCGSPFNTDGFGQILLENEQMRDNIVNSINNLVDEINSSIGKIEEQQRLSSETQNKIAQLNAERYKLVDCLRSIEQYNMAKDSIQEAETELNEMITTRAQKVDNVSKFNEEYEMYSLLESVYSDNGVKKYHREKYIPTLNSELKASLEFIGFPYQLTFDNEFNAHLKHRGDKINIETLSAGERKKVDMCVLCSLIRIIKQKYPSINIIGLDETISSLDYESSVTILKYLKKISEDLGVNILVVSHTTLDESMFDKRLFIDKVDGFSTIQYV